MATIKNPLEIKDPVTYFFLIGWLLYFVERHLFENPYFLMVIGLYMLVLTIWIATVITKVSKMEVDQKSKRAAILSLSVQCIASLLLLGMAVYDLVYLHKFFE